MFRKEPQPFHRRQPAPGPSTSISSHARQFESPLETSAPDTATTTSAPDLEFSTTLCFKRQSGKKVVLQMTEIPGVETLFRSLDDRPMEVVYMTLGEYGDYGQRIAVPDWDITGSLVRVENPDGVISHYFVFWNETFLNKVYQDLGDNKKSIPIAELRLYDHEYNQNVMIYGQETLQIPEAAPEWSYPRIKFQVVNEVFADQIAKIESSAAIVTRFLGSENGSYKAAESECSNSIRDLPNAALVKDDLESGRYNDREWFTFPMDKNTRYKARQKIRLLCRDGDIRNERFAFVYEWQPRGMKNVGLVHLVELQNEQRIVGSLTQDSFVFLLKDKTNTWSELGVFAFARTDLTIQAMRYAERITGLHLPNEHTWKRGCELLGFDPYTGECKYPNHRWKYRSESPKISSESSDDDDNDDNSNEEGEEEEEDDDDGDEEEAEAHDEAGTEPWGVE